jgi:putative transposase
VHAAALVCRVLGVSVSGYHAWRKRPPSRRAVDDAELTARIKEIHAMSDGTYGAPRIRAELADVDGRKVGLRHVARLMRKAGIAGVSRRRFCVTTTRDGTPVSPDLVERKFAADVPNKLWVADITYVPTWAGFLFLAVVIDVWSRKVVGWATANHLKTDLVLAALDTAVAQRQPSAVIHHSDHGTQYTSIAFGQRCKQAGCSRRWARSATPTTTRSASPSSRASNASCSTGTPSSRRARPAWRSSGTSRAGTTRTVGTRLSTISHR